MVSISRTTIIDRPVAEVFAYLCEVEHGPQYISGQREAHQTSTGPMSIGTTFVTTSSKFPHRHTRFEITDYEPDRCLAWKALSRARTTTTWGLQPYGSKTRINFTRVMEPHGFLRLPESLVQELANESVSRELAALNRLLAVRKPPPRDSYLGKRRHATVLNLVSQGSRGVRGEPQQHLVHPKGSNRVEAIA